ncbi:MAG: ead/Ea22-like family protein [Xanthobacteraceae bacterium]|nr:ead/Ea22-like family protein [Xanthobacteraceae bacterium]MCW5679656.1 ead/Ea22-like family protein [Xanthobacteraceae bacterium]
MTERVKDSEKVEHTELRELAEAATPGPWAATLDENYSVVTGPDGAAIALPDYETGICLEEADAAFIAAANPKTVLALLAERDRLREALEEATRHIERALEASMPLKGVDGAGVPYAKRLQYARDFVGHAHALLKDTNQ